MISNWYTGVLYILGLAGFSVAALLIVRRGIGSETLRRHNEVASPIHTAICAVYGVLMAFVVVVVYEQYNAADAAAIDESTKIVALNRDIMAFPDAPRESVRKALEAYTSSVLYNEWPRMKQDENVDSTSRRIYLQLWRVFRDAESETKDEAGWYNSARDRINELDESRSLRLRCAKSHVPTAMWVTLIFGGIVTILFTCLFGAERKDLHLVMTCALALVIGMVLFLIAALEGPFGGVVTVDPGPIQRALNVVQMR